MRARVLAATTAALALAACNLDPAYVRPAPPVPASFPQGPAYAPNQPGPAASEVRWREFFTDPNLRSVIELALDNNRDLRVAAANIEAARAQYRIERSNLFPSVGANGSATVARPGGGAPTEHLYSVSLGFSAWELDLFGRIRSLSRAALEQFLATEEARRATQTSLIAEVASDYEQLAADRQLLTVAQQTLAAQQASLDLTRARFAAGVASALDVDQAQTTVETARADVAQFTTQAAQDQNALNLVAGTTAPDALLPAGLAATPGMMVDLPAGVSSTVLLMRPDILQAEHQLRANNADIGAARAAFFPTITLTAGAGAASTALSGLFDTAARTWSFVPTISLPIFNAGRTRANLHLAQAQRDAAVAQYERAIQAAFQEVADALARRGTIADQIGADQRLVAAATEAVQLTNARYQRGTDPYLNVLVAQRTLYSAQQALVSIRLVQLTNAVSLYRALGGGVG